MPGNVSFDLGWHWRLAFREIWLAVNAVGMSNWQLAAYR